MKSPTAPARRAGRLKDPEKRQAILDAASELFLAHGYGATTLDAVAAAAGVSKLTVYSHFGDKEGLFRTLVACKCEEEFAGADISALAQLPPEQALAHFVAGFVKLLYAPDVLALYRILIGDVVQNAVAIRVFYENGPRPTIDAAAQLLAALTARGALAVPKPAQAAEQLLAMIEGDYFMRALLDLGLPPAREYKRYMADAVAAFVRAYAPPP